MDARHQRAAAVCESDAAVLIVSTARNVRGTRIEPNPAQPRAAKVAPWHRAGTYHDPRSVHRRKNDRYAEMHQPHQRLKAPALWHASIYRYPDQTAEVTLFPRADHSLTIEHRYDLPTRHWYDQPSRIDAYLRCRRPFGDLLHRSRPRDPRENADRAARRARAAVRRLVRYHNMRRLLTLTNGSEKGWRSRRECLDDVALFLRVHGRRLFGDDSTGVAIAERGGQHGRWHAHVALGSTAKRWDYDEVYRSWSAFLENRGHHSTTSGHRWHDGDEQGRFKRTAKNARALAAYMVKYISKSLDQDAGHKGEHRYRGWRATAPKPQRGIFRSLDLAARVLAIDEPAQPLERDDEGNWRPIPAGKRIEEPIRAWTKIGMRPIFHQSGRFLCWRGDLDHLAPLPVSIEGCIIERWE